jgi:radical SAM superfamily enzyme YgiQ (UPF0313 family)
MHIHILQARHTHGLRQSKDTNGGYGTVNDFGRGLAAIFLKYLKRSTMNFPELLPAYVRAILKRQGHTVTYGENQINPQAEIVLLQTSIVNYSKEIAWAHSIKKDKPSVRIGFMGGMSSGNVDLYQPLLDEGFADFVISGEAENALLQSDIASFSGIVQGGQVKEPDRLPFPDWSHLDRKRYGYRTLAARSGKFLPVLSSRGCPMSCAYYCTYPLVQGANFRGRTPVNVVDELDYLQSAYETEMVMFRDPIFSLNMNRVAEICELIIKRGIKISWICETHPRFLKPDLIRLMAQAGCRTVKLGIESGNLQVMQGSRRAAPDLEYQEKTIACLEENGIQVFAFYILGYMDDTQETINQTIDYAIQLNTYGAQFTIATPYPGTEWYAELQSQSELFQLDRNLEHYNQYRLVFQHKNISFDILEHLKSFAYQRYYFRADYIFKHILHL